MLYPSAMTDISSNTAGKQLVRLGYMVKLSSGSTLAFAFVWGTAEVVDCS